MKKFLTLTLAVFLIGCAQQESAESIHKRALVLDAHADIELPDAPSRYAAEDGTSRVAPEKMRAGGVDAVVMSAAVGPMPRAEEGYAEAWAIAEAEIAAVRALAEDPQVSLVLSADELLAAHAAGRSALILGMQNALILGRDVTRLDALHAAGVRVFALTHMGHNDFADSSRPLFDAATGTHEPAEEHGGLSELGRAAITRVNDLGGVVDISQLSRAAALEVMALSRAPVIASHSNVQTLTSVSRNLSDEEIDRIAEIGGVIHVAPFRGYLFDSSDKALDDAIRAARREAGVKEDYLYPFELYWEMDDPAVQTKFLSTVSDLLGPSSVDDMLNHIDYIARRVGVEHVGIGTDFNHGSGVTGFNDAGEALNVTRGLLARGYSPEDIEKIWGGNFVRVWQEAADRVSTCENALTEAEAAEGGWQLLFDGQSLEGWRSYGAPAANDGWAVRDGCLTRVGRGGDLITSARFGDFELRLDWRVSQGGNSGIFIRGDESGPTIHHSGFEMQVLDNAGHPDAEDPTHRAGAYYDMIAPDHDTSKPAGLWNTVRIVADGPSVTYWLNGRQTAAFEQGSDAWQALLEKSKFRDRPAYGTLLEGHIGLQDHGDEVWYRNIRIRALR